MSFTRRFGFLILSLALLNGCASKQPKPIPPLPVLPSPSGASTPKNPLPPEDPTANLPPSSQVGEAGSGEGGKAERTVALVLGGAGVASFATVGILKRLKEEGVRIDFIVTTGWPTLFALGYGFLKSVHDLEWFAMRLQERDFYSVGFFQKGQDFADHDKLSKLIQGAFKQTDMNESKVPLIISAANTDLGEPEIFERGDWKAPLLMTMSVPGIFRPYTSDVEDSGWINSLTGIDVDEAHRRGADVVIAIEMYDDYFDLVRTGGGKKTESDALFRRLYLTHLRKDLAKQMKGATYQGKIRLGKSPIDYAQKRLAILAGYKEAARIAKYFR